VGPYLFISKAEVIRNGQIICVTRGLEDRQTAALLI